MPRGMSMQEASTLTPVSVVMTELAPTISVDVMNRLLMKNK